jgi:hypothetical protein
LTTNIGYRDADDEKSDNEIYSKFNNGDRSYHIAFENSGVVK